MTLMESIASCVFFVVFDELGDGCSCFFFFFLFHKSSSRGEWYVVEKRPKDIVLTLS